MTSSIQPIYLSHAQLFTYDQDGSSRAWVPVHTQPVPTSIMFDATRGLYRLISVDPACKMVIANSTIVGHLEFHKTSQRFGHWRDQATGTVYGIGFKTEQQLEDFADCIRKAKAAFSSTSTTCTSKKTSNKTLPNSLQNFQTPPEHAHLRELISRLGLATEPAKLEEEMANLPAGDHLEVILPPRVENQQNDAPSFYNQEPAHPEHDLHPIQAEKLYLQQVLASFQVQYGEWEVQLDSLRRQTEELLQAMRSLKEEMEEKKGCLLRVEEKEARLNGVVCGESGQGDGGGDELEKRYKSLLESANRMVSEAIGRKGGEGADALFCRAIHELTGLHGEVVRGRRKGEEENDGGGSGNGDL